MKLPSVLAGVPRIVLVLVVPIVAFLVTIGISLGTNDTEERPPAAPTVAVVVTNRQALATPTSVPQSQPTPSTVLTDRTDCSAIRGTDYRSASEQDWFKKNCSGTGTASANAGTGTSGSSGSSNSSAPRTAAASSGAQAATGQRLVISKAKVNTDIYVTKMASYDMPNPVGYFNALTYDMSAYPGLGGDASSGNLVMSGHVDCGKCYNGGAGTAVFWNVRDLQPGDTAQVYTADGKVVNYVVTKSAAYSANQDYTPFVSSSAADMTIITCTGTFASGEYDRRHVVQFKKA